MNGQTIKDFKKDIRGLKKAVNLNQDQVQKLTDVYTKIVTDIENLKQANLSEEDFRKKRRAVYQGAEFSIAQIISSDQQAAFEIYQRKIRENRAKETMKLRKQKAPEQDLMDAQVGVKRI